MTLPETLLAAMKAENIPAGASGLWFIRKLAVPAPVLSDRRGQAVLVPAGVYTYLRRLTDSTLYPFDDQLPGEVVMEDTPFELRTHLGFALQARGRVLVTGLGLGCVVRGLLANPAVESVTCIENSPDVLKLVAPYMPAERLAIIEADAFEWAATNTQPFDCAWHDLWTDRDAGEPHLDFWHARLLMNCKRFAAQQGAWAFERNLKKRLVQRGFRWIG